MPASPLHPPPIALEKTEFDKDILAEDVTPALNQIVADSIPPIATGLAVLYLIFGVSHLFLLPESIKTFMAVMALGTAVILIIVSYLGRRYALPRAYAHPVAAGISFLALLNSLVHLYLLPEPRLTTNISLLIIGVGIFFLSVRWLVLLLTLSIVGWAAVTWPMVSDPAWIHFAFLQVGSTFVSALAHMVRFRSARHIEQLRRQDKMHRQELRQAAYEARQRAQELEAAKETAEAANRAKTAFLNKISHELRTPLTIIIGYAEFLQEKYGSAEEQELQAIENAGHELLKKVNDIIDLSSFEARQIAVHISTFRITELIDEIVPDAQRLMAINRNVLTVFYADGLGFVSSDVAKVQKILFNLLDNAAKFTEDGEITLRVTRATAVAGQPDYIQFQVSDTGIGIPPKELPHLFEIFHQGDESSKRRYGGAGVGLALAKRYCYLLGGEINVESSVNKGTVITVRLPAQSKGFALPDIPAISPEEFD